MRPIGDFARKRSTRASGAPGIAWEVATLERAPPGGEGLLFPEEMGVLHLGLRC